MENAPWRVVAGVWWDSPGACVLTWSDPSMFPCLGPPSFPQADTHFWNLPVPFLSSLFSSPEFLPWMWSNLSLSLSFFFHSSKPEPVRKGENGAVSSFSPWPLLSQGSLEKQMSAGKSESCRAGWTLRQEPMLLEVEFLLPQGNFGLTLKVFQLTGRGSLSLTFS